MSKLKGNEIVISGISGLYPGANNMQELSEKLYNKIDMVSKTKKYPDVKHPELPQYHGTIENMKKFDPHFFKVTSNQVKCVEPMLMKTLEQTMCALFDAGINPATLKNKKVGVFIACSQTDSINYFFKDVKGVPLILTGCSKCMFANRISYWLDLKAPSYSFDQGYVGSMSALEMAYNSLKNGDIEYAIVGSCNYIIKPELTLNMKRAGFLCLDGKTKCFDKNADGFVRSDAVNILILQKAIDAKRIYSEVYHVKGEYFASPDGCFSFKRDPKDIEHFLEEFYSEIGVNPNYVDYIEANSVGIAEADANELEAVGNVFAKERTLNIGSIKSNMGNAECASGICSVAKLCLAYQKGQIPANLHFEEPQLQIKAVHENKLKVVTENTPFDRTFAGINSFCYTGNNFHALFKGHFIPKDKQRYKSPIPRLVLVSSRDEMAVNKILNVLESSPIDPEQLALLNNIYKCNVPGYTGRGYTIIDSSDEKTVSLSRGFQYFSGKTGPICFLYSGMGSQWAGMGEGLLKISIFAAAIERCNKILLGKGLDIKEIISNRNPNSLDIKKSLVAITAIQIGLTDILKSIGIYPDIMIGHSLGEIACAYADGALTTEEAILTAYYRALVSHETKFIAGGMAAVGIGYQEAKLQCPPEIEIACHNSFDSCTLSGPKQILKEFVKKLQDQGIFAKEVDSYDIAFHSRYIQEAGLPMQNMLKEVLPQPKLRSSKWLSTCYLAEEWQNSESHYASAEYFTHNLMGSVLFEEAANRIPKDSIIIEIAPHGLLQAIMKRSHKECTNVSITKRGESDTVKFLLNAIGNMYKMGINPDLESLYPKVEFPVSTETSLLSHLVEWDYGTTDWLLDFDSTNIEEKSIEKEYTISLLDEEFAFLKQHTRNDMFVLSEATLLVFVWATLADHHNKDYKITSVTFENVAFYENILLAQEEILKLQVTIQRGSKQFEILLKNKLVAVGVINFMENSTKMSQRKFFRENETYLTKRDIYTLLETRGYQYENALQLIQMINKPKTKATLKWCNQWSTFVDSLIQIVALSSEHDGLSWVKFINQLSINVTQHLHSSIIRNNSTYYNALVSDVMGRTQCGGVVIEDIVFKIVPKTEIVFDISKHMKINIGNGHFKHNGLTTSKHKLQQVKLIAREPNNIDSLTWAETPAITSKAAIQVHYSGLSAKDYQNLESSYDRGFGMDFSGLDINGERVMGVVSQGSIASMLEADMDLLWPVPQHWSLAEASTVPLPYVLAFYCLVIRHTLHKNSIILVIGAAGALGQAIISIALHLKCRIFATVGNVEKKKLLLRLFPELDENDISFTYDNAFRDMIIERTENKRCHVVINTASGEIRENAMQCVGDIFQYYFLDLNDSDQKENKILPMSFLAANKNYKSVRLSTIFDEKYSKYKKILQNLLCDGIAKGYVRPLTSIIYSPRELSRAFKLLKNRSNVGRVIMCMTDWQGLNQTTQEIHPVPRLGLYPNKTYILIWDGAVLGVELINVLVQRGAKRLLINCSPKDINGYFHLRYASWREQGVHIEFNSDDLRQKSKCQKLLEDALTLGYVDGIFIVSDEEHETNIIADKEKTDILPVLSNVDGMTRKYQNLRYFAVVIATSKYSPNQQKIKELEKCCLLRSKHGLTSLFLRHFYEDKVWLTKSLPILLNGLETSLQSKFVNVTTTSIDKQAKKYASEKSAHTNFEAGFSAFYRNISNEEHESIEPIVHLKTKSDLFYKDELMVDPDVNHLIMIPGFESNAQTFAPLAELLKQPAVALQMDLDYGHNVADIAQKLLDNIKRTLRIKSPFYLLGYSFGVNVALEMAALLEKEGLVGVLYCIYSSPDAVRVHLDAYLGKLTEEELQNSLIEHIFSLFVGFQSNELKAKLKNITIWREKVKLFTNMVKNNELHTHEYIKHFLETAYRRIILAKEHKPSFVLDSELVLIKGLSHPNAIQLNHDYNLSTYSKKKVKIFNVKSDHAMALYDCEIPYIINTSRKKHLNDSN